MAYSRKYQEVVAGRVREDEGTFGSMNKVATPAGTFTAFRVSGNADKEAPLAEDHLNTTQAGKARTVVNGENPVVTNYNAGSNNSAKY